MAVINVLICPSDPAPTTLVPIGGGNYAIHNYPMCTGSNDSVVQIPTGNLTGIVSNGVLFENSAIRPTAITDGTSKPSPSPRRSARPKARPPGSAP